MVSRVFHEHPWVFRGFSVGFLPWKSSNDSWAPHREIPGGDAHNEAEQVQVGPGSWEGCANHMHHIDSQSTYICYILYIYIYTLYIYIYYICIYILYIHYILYICMCVCMYICIQTKILLWCTCVCTLHVYIYIYRYACVYKLHTHIHTYIHTYIYIYACIIYIYIYSWCVHSWSGRKITRLASSQHNHPETPGWVLTVRAHVGVFDITGMDWPSPIDVTNLHIVCPDGLTPARYGCNRAGVF